MARLYSYNRVSTAEQAQALAQQRHMTQLICDLVCAKFPEITERVPHMEDQFSAFKTEFHKRPAGSIICKNLQPGDHICCSNFDRMFRNNRDFANQLKIWDDMKVVVHFGDLGISINHANWKMIATIMSAVAENYSARLSERMKLSYLQRYIREGKHNPRRKVLVSAVNAKDGSALDYGIINKQVVAYLRFVVWKRRASYRKNGVADSWTMCSDALERLRVARGDITEYRIDTLRGPYARASLWVHINRLLTVEIPAVTSSWWCVGIRNGLNPIKLPAKSASDAHMGLKLKPRERESIWQIARATNVTKPKRWTGRFDECVECHTTEYKHSQHGICKRCYRENHLNKQRKAQLV